MSDKGIVQGDVRDCRHKPAVETGVVTPETGMRVYGDDGGDYLRGKKKENGDVQRSLGDLELLIKVGLDSPGRSNKSGHQVNKHYFVELEYFRGKWPEN